MKISLINLKQAHFSLFYRWWNDPVLRKLTSEIKGKISNNKVDKILGEHLASENGNDFIITVDQKPVGHILIQKKKRKKHFEVYIAIGEKDFWGKGVGTEAMKKACRWFFKNRPKENALELEVLVNNPRAIRSYDKAGFKRVRIIHNKKNTDTVLMRKER